MQFKSVLKISLFYTIANGLNRAKAFIHIPFLINSLTISEFGVFSLVQTLGQLLIPILIVSSTSAIIRESTHGIEWSFKVYKNFSSISLILNGICGSMLLMGVDNIYFYSFCLASTNGLNELNLSWFRVNNKYTKFISSVMLTTGGLLMLYVTTLYFDFTLTDILKFQYLILLAVSLTFNLLSVGVRSYQIDLSYMKSIVNYTILIIPHGISLWAMGSADRVIIKYLLNDEMLGYYSLAYSIAMLLSFVNSGLSSTFPQMISKDYSNWDFGKMNKQVLGTYAIVAVALFAFLMVGMQIDKAYLDILNYHSKTIITIITLVFIGIYCLGNYTFYSYFLIHNKRTDLLAKCTLFAAGVNLMLTTIGVYFFGIIGAGVATLITYLIYVILIFYQGAVIEYKLKSNKTFLIRTIVSVCLINVTVYVLFLYLFY